MLPVQYAPTRASSRFEVFRHNAFLLAPNNPGVDAIRDGLLAAGWTLPNPCAVQATGGMENGYGLFTPVLGGGTGINHALTWLGVDYFWFDPLHDPDPSGPGVVGVVEGATVQRSLENLCTAATGAGWVWSFVAPHGIRVDATCALLGTAGNGYIANGKFGESLQTAGGGWQMYSQSANSTSQIIATLTADGGLKIAVDLSGHVSTGELQDLGFHTLVANPYQFAIFADAAQDQLVMIASAPWVDPRFVATLGFTALVLRTNAFNPNVFTVNLNTGIHSLVVCNGSAMVGATGDVLMWSYDSDAALITSAGKPIVDQCRLFLPIAPGGEARYVGAIWDTFTESADYGEGKFVSQEGRTWRVLNRRNNHSGVESGAAGTLWVAVD